MLDFNLICFKKTPLLCGNLDLTEGVWVKLELDKGNLEICYLNHLKELVTKKKLKTNDSIWLSPGLNYEIKSIDTKDNNFSGQISYYCKRHRYFNKKYDLSNVHSDLLYASNNYFNSSNLNILDVGCGSGRNLLYFALNGHHVDGIDVNNGALNRIKQICLTENFNNVNVEMHDLNQKFERKKKYDLIISTVTLQFLNPDRVKPLLEELQLITAPEGIHLLVFPVQAAEFNLPASFKYLAQKNELYNFYHAKGFSILEYKETVGQLHRLDESGRPIQGLFAFLLAQKISF